MISLEIKLQDIAEKGELRHVIITALKEWNKSEINATPQEIALGEYISDRIFSGQYSFLRGLEIETKKEKKY